MKKCLARPAIPDLEQIANQLRKDKRTMGTWGAVAGYYGLTKPLVWRVALKGYEPKKALIRHRLGLPEMAPAPVCPVHGVVHVAKRCPTPATNRPRVPYFGLSQDEWDARLRWILENRDEGNGK